MMRESDPMRQRCQRAMQTLLDMVDDYASTLAMARVNINTQLFAVVDIHCSRMEIRHWSQWRGSRGILDVGDLLTDCVLQMELTDTVLAACLLSQASAFRNSDSAGGVQHLGHWFVRTTGTLLDAPSTARREWTPDGLVGDWERETERCNGYAAMDAIFAFERARIEQATVLRTIRSMED